MNKFKVIGFLAAALFTLSSLSTANAMTYEEMQMQAMGGGGQGGLQLGDRSAASSILNCQCAYRIQTGTTAMDPSCDNQARAIFNATAQGNGSGMTIPGQAPQQMPQQMVH